MGIQVNNNGSQNAKKRKHKIHASIHVYTTKWFAFRSKKSSSVAGGKKVKSHDRKHWIIITHYHKGIKMECCFHGCSSPLTVNDFRKCNNVNGCVFSLALQCVFFLRNPYLNDYLHISCKLSLGFSLLSGTASSQTIKNTVVI